MSQLFVKLPGDNAMRVRPTCYLTKAMGIVILVAGALGATAMAGPGGGGGHGGGGGGGGHGGGGFHGGGGGFRGGGFRGGYHGGYGGGFRGGYRGGYGGAFRGGYGGGWYGGGYGPWGYWGGWGLGLYLPFLPLGYSTYYWGGVPYYYADDALYSWDADTGEYVTVAPPDGSPDVAPPKSSAATRTRPATTVDLFAYPKAGQSEAQQARDRDECRQWASAQNVADSNQTPSDSAAAGPVRAGYLRAEAACLEGRNYSVK
jgi:hypothetical protein